MKSKLFSYLIIVFLLSFFNLYAENSFFRDSTGTKNDTTVVQNDQKNVDSTILTAPKGLTAKQVIQTYVDSLGGRKNLRSVNDRVTIMRGKVQGVNVTMIIYQKVPNKLKQVIKAGAMDQKLYFNGKVGKIIVGKKTIDVTGSELEKLKYEATMNLILDLDHFKITTKLLGIARVNGKDAYKVEIDLPSGSPWFQYYDTETGLKLKESKYVVSMQGTFIQDTYYYDFRDVDGVKYPFRIKETVANQTLDFRVSSVQVNTGLIDREFEPED